MQDASGKTNLQRDIIIIDTSASSSCREIFEETLPVAADEADVLLAFLIDGPGTAWLDGVKLEDWRMELSVLPGSGDRIPCKAEPMFTLHLPIGRPGAGLAARPTPGRALRSLLVICLIPGSGCRSTAGEGSRAVVRDSAGVEVVLNTGPRTEVPSGWAVTAEPVLSIGSVEGDEALQFFGIAGAHRLSDGRIGVVDAGSREVRFYDARGNHLSSMGKQGGGPEEFEMPALAGSIGDTLVIVDRAHHRLTFVHPDQGFVGQSRVADDVGGFLNPVGSLAGGQSVFGGAFDMRRIGELRNGMNRAHTFYRSCHPDGSLATDFGNKAGAEFFIRDLEGTGQDSRPALIPFGRVPVATTSSSHLFFGDQGTWEIEVHASDGTLVRLIRQEWEPEPVTPEHGERYIEETVALTGNPEEALQLRQYLHGLPLPEHFPPFGNLLADRLGYLWVQDFQRPGEETSAWTLYDPRGVRAGRLTLPPRFIPLEIGSDYVLGLARDELSVEYIRLHGLERPAGR